MTAFGYPYQSVPGSPFLAGGYPPNYGNGYGYGAQQGYGAWYALLIVLFIIIILFWGVWAFGNCFY